MKSRAPKTVSSSLLKKKRKKELKIKFASGPKKLLESQEKRKKNANARLKPSTLKIKTPLSMELEQDGRME